MTDMLREVSSSIDNLAMGRIPHYLIPLSLVQNILTSATAGPASPIQTHLAFSLGSTIPLCVDPEAGDLAFLLSLPIIDSINSIYRLKDVVNVGFWQGNTYVKIHTPEVVAYHDNNEQLHLAPNLRMCTRTKDIHFLCPSKPFARDNTEGICGLESIRPDTSCPAEATPCSQVEVTQAEIIGNQWLVNAPAPQSWSAADTALCISTIVGYVVTLTLAFLLHKRVNAVQVFQQMHIRRPTHFPT